MLPDAIFREFVQSVAGHNSELVECLYPIEQLELVERAALDVSRQPTTSLTLPDALSFGGGIGEGEDQDGALGNLFADFSTIEWSNSSMPKSKPLNSFRNFWRNCDA